MGYWKRKGAIIFEWFEMRMYGASYIIWLYYIFLFEKVNSEVDFERNLMIKVKVDKIPKVCASYITI
jgi:hypothetical protein